MAFFIKIKLFSYDFGLGFLIMKDEIKNEYIFLNIYLYCFEDMAYFAEYRIKSDQRIRTKNFILSFS